MALSSVGYRIIAVDYPPYWNVDDFCVGFRKLLDSLGLKEVSCKNKNSIFNEKIDRKIKFIPSIALSS